MESRLLWGTMEMLILDVVSRGHTYGYEIAQTVTAESEGYFQFKEGSLYPALHRMARQKLLTAYWGESETGHRRKYYKFTAKGQRALEDKKDQWKSFTQSVEGVLRHGLRGAHGMA